MKKLILLVALATAATLQMGCQKADDGGGGVAVTGGYWGNCTNCQGIQTGQALLQNVQGSDQYMGISLNLQVYGTVTPNCIQPINKQIFCAQGAGSLAGSLRVTNPNNVCGLPAGDYSLRAIQASQLYSAMLYGGAYEATGPAGNVLRIQLAQAILYNGQGSNGLDLNSTQNKINISAALVRGDGASCGMLSTY